MTIQLRAECRNARLDAIETYGTTAAAISVFSGAQPGGCTSANSGTELWAINLPSDWMGAAANGTKAKAGTWSGTAGSAGTAGHFRLYNSTGTKDGTTCFMQGSCDQGSGDMSFDNKVLAAGQTVTVNSFNLTDGNA